VPLADVLVLVDDGVLDVEFDAPLP